MLDAFGLRTLTAIAVIVAAAVAITLHDGSLQGGLMVLVGGIAAVLIAAGTGDAVTDVPLPIAQIDDPRSSPVNIDEMIEAIVEPILIVAEGRVAHANLPARSLLGGHIIGEDVRLAIRHPAAAERLTNMRAPAYGPINLVGLGTLDQRWEMRVTTMSDGRRVVHLIDQTGSYAAERMRVDFVANASHELRTPLASILGFVETLGDDKAGGDAQVRARFLKVMFDEARRMQRLVEDLISLSRIEAEKYRVPATEVDLRQLMEEVHAELADTHDNRGDDLVTDIEADVPHVVGDRAQLSQVLHNLIGNAMKYGKSGTPVVTRLWKDQTGMVRISVTDEGEGIAPEHLPRLTERFYRVDAGRSRSLGGTGLGLAIVKHIIERHRGRLDITSVVGKGTTASILLPASPAVAMPRKAQSSNGNLTVTQATRSG
ncbi:MULTISPECIES: cell wall metabolism sensor histidine kinase WalK [unclassified Sphingomonas]|uniref:sensor histidine kinase n=1 Tax=unclassified Sphingomonas TaxID=196159 RepID=UPI000BC64CD0|nr:MAG: ATPase [Sphingomonas sp. 32-62-10]